MTCPAETMSGSKPGPPASNTPVLTKDIIADAQYLAYSFDFSSECVAYLPVSREELQKATMLKRGLIAPDRALIQVPLAEIANLLDAQESPASGRPPQFIFHTAFCASTFLSRCLDIEGHSVSLREPQLLLDAANAKRLRWRAKSTSLDFQDLPRLFLKLLQKHATASETLVIKPINSVNNIALELLQAAPDSKALMLYTDARNFVLSMLGKGEGSKQTVRSMFDLIRCDFSHLSNLQLTHVIHMSDLRIAMTLWRLQIEQAEAILQELSDTGRMASLYGETLIRQPLDALAAANQFLNLGLSSEQVNAIATSDDRFIDAKNPEQRFSLEKRAQRYEKLESFFGKDLDDGLGWLQRSNPQTRLLPELEPALPL